jgi:5'(3')-deoxyribonucleotidase
MQNIIETPLEGAQSANVANIDLDNSVANFKKKIIHDLNMMRGPTEEEFTVKHLDDPPPWLDFRLKLIKRQPGFWRNLEVIELGMKVVGLIREAGFSLNVLTNGPRRNHPAWTEKVEWSTNVLPDANVTVTMEKGLVYGKVLFDDWPPYILSWLAHRPRGVVLMLDHEWNQGFEHPQVVRIQGEEDFPEVRRRLAARAAL